MVLDAVHLLCICVLIAQFTIYWLPLYSDGNYTIVILYILNIRNTVLCSSLKSMVTLRCNTPDCLLLHVEG